MSIGAEAVAVAITIATLEGVSRRVTRAVGWFLRFMAVCFTGTLIAGIVAYSGQAGCSFEQNMARPPLSARPTAIGGTTYSVAHDGNTCTLDPHTAAVFPRFP